MASEVLSLAKRDVSSALIDLTKANVSNVGLIIIAL